MGCDWNESHMSVFCKAMRPSQVYLDGCEPALEWEKVCASHQLVGGVVALAADFLDVIDRNGWKWLICCCLVFSRLLKFGGSIWVVHRHLAMRCKIAGKRPAISWEIDEILHISTVAQASDSSKSSEGLRFLADLQLLERGHWWRSSTHLRHKKTQLFAWDSMKAADSSSDFHSL